MDTNDKWVRDTKIELTNWTFGYWWGKIGKKNCRGLEFGPLQVIWRKNV